jgi:restriction system protein
LLQKVYSQDPYDFEHTVAKLLKAMGYGDTWDQSVQVTKKSGDDGVDGLVREDRLGFDVVYYQAKRWALDSTVGRPDINAFAGALLGKGASKGVFITTGRFSKAAREYAESLKQQRVVLVDGNQLADYMIDHNVGVSPVETFEVKAIDSDFFGGE